MPSLRPLCARCRAWAGDPRGKRRGDAVEPSPSRPVSLARHPRTKIGEPDGLFTGDLGLVDFTLELEGLASERLREALAPTLPLGEAFEGELGFLGLAVHELGSESPELTVDARWEGGRIFGTGSLQDGLLVAMPNATDPAVIDFELRPFWTKSVVGALLPFLKDLAPVEDGPSARLELRAFTLPIDGGLEELSGTFRLSTFCISS